MSRPQRTRARSFRLGAPEVTPSAWRRFGPTVLAFVVGAVLFGVGGYLVGSPAEEASMAADIRAADAVRDKQQIKDLTELTRTTGERFAPVLTGLGAPGAPAATVAEWRTIVTTAATSFADPPSGTTATNVARGSIAAAVDQLTVAVDTYAVSPELALRQRDLAVTTWSIGSTQLDQINVDAGNGHQHVFLPGNGHGGAFTPDEEPEGTGPR
jgi:hypothetical protein